MNSEIFFVCRIWYNKSNKRNNRGRNGLMEKKEVTKGENITQELNTRNVSYDLLRICAAVMVVLLHIAASNWYSVSPDKAEWVAMNLYDSMARSAVPLFFMLSGAFLLRKDITLKELYMKKIVPLGIIWGVWSFLYAVDTIGLDRMLSTNFTDIVTPTVDSHYHLWFIPTLIGLYILHPILRGIVSYREGSYIRYLLAIFIIFGVVKTTLLVFIQNPILVTLIYKIPMELMGYSCYMIMGYYFANISKYKYTPPLRKIMLLLFGLSVIICTVITQIDSLNEGKGVETLYGYFSITTFLEAACVFLFFKNIKWNCSIKFKKIVFNLSSLTFGVYLIHPFVISCILRVNRSVFTDK